MTDDFVYIRFKVERTGVDPTPYKVYSPVLLPAADLFVEVKLHKKYIVEETPLVLTPKGMALALKKISNAISTVYSDSEGEN